MISKLFILASLAYGSYARSIDEYMCSFCQAATDVAIEKKLTFKSACHSMFPEDICLLFGEGFSIKGNDARNACQLQSYCPSTVEEEWRTSSLTTSSPLDIRITKAYGSRGYDKVRVSVISNSTVQSDYFTYSEQFKYRWTQYVLNTGVVSITPGQKTTLNIAGENFDITIPKQGDGIRGVVIGDPCFTSEWIVCVYSKSFSMFEHTIELLNAINSHDDVSYWRVLGDNFYDQNGEPTGEWFSALSKESKSKVMASVPGNHDFWINASPKLWVPKKDQLGNGFMQMYGQDVASSITNFPYDFAHNPDAEDGDAENIPNGGNYFYYHQLGNVGFVGYSGAHKSTEMQSYFEEACTWATQQDKLDVLLLEGHWNSDGDGCDNDMTVPEVYKSMINNIPACSQISSKIRYIMGHAHCNIIVEQDIGFMVGGQGMSDHNCGGEFGIPIVDTTEGRFRIYYFPIQKFRDYDNYDTTLQCFKENGVSGCYHLATLWTDTPIA